MALPDGIDPMQYVMVTHGKALPLSRLRDAGTLSENGLVISWSAGRNSLHDSQVIANGRDLVTVTVQDDAGKDVDYDAAFAFAFAAFVPGGEWMLEN